MNTLSRLCPEALSTLPGDVERPGYDRSAVACGVVHLGIGAFHRAHQAVYFDDALQRGDLRWGVTGVSLRSPQVRNALLPQDGLYSMIVRQANAERLRVIGAVREVLVAPEDPAAVVARMADPGVHLITLTVTEKGYKLDPATGSLRCDDADVAADLLDLSAPRTAPGFIVAALAARRAAGVAPFTVLSCDNLPDNGHRLRAAVLEMALVHDAELSGWIESAVAFPCSMVDRIVPATTEADRRLAAQRLGVEDRACVATEGFCQWVIENRFSGPHPDFAALGAQLTDDVAAWEAAKLRLLNGAHSAMAYLGGLAGLSFVHDVVARPEGAALVRALWAESAETLRVPAGLDLSAYQQQLLQRFANPALNHRLHQIAMDGSQKLPQRLLAPLSERLAAGKRVEVLSLAVAAWMRWQAGEDDAGEPFTVDDPMHERIAEVVADCRSPAERVRALLGIDAIFAPALAASAPLRQLLSVHLGGLEWFGATALLQELLQETVVG